MRATLPGRGRRRSGRCRGASRSTPTGRPSRCRPRACAAIHDAAMRVLEEIGIEFLNEEARDYLARRRLRGRAAPNVRMDRGFVMEQVAKAPRQFDMTPRNPERAGDDGRAAHVLRQRLVAAELHGPRPRPAGREHATTSANFMRLTQYFNCIHVAGGYPVEPVDIHAERPPPRLPLREADADRQGGARLQPRAGAGRGRDRDGADRRRPRRRTSSRAQPRMFTNINSSSPAEARLADARRRDALRPAGAAGDRDAVHPGRGDGAGDDGGRGGAVDRRGAGGDRAPAGGAAGRRPA